MDTIITPEQQVLNDLATQGGGTYTKRDLVPFMPPFGYAVAVGGIELAEAAVTPDIIRWAAYGVAGEYGTDLVGTWLHEGIVYLDAVRYIRDRSAAIRLGQDCGQLAIFDFATKESIDL